jgi:hypothetical protein
MLWGVLGNMDNPMRGWGCMGVARTTDYVVNKMQSTIDAEVVIILDTRVNIFGMLDEQQFQ